MSAVYKVKPGDHISSIAAKFGFESFFPIWEHEKNLKLKELREDPHLLAAGDELFIPDRVLPVFSRSTASSHDFVVRSAKLSLRVRLLDRKMKPKAGQKVVLTVPPPENGEPRSSEQELVTDGDGKVTTEIAKSAQIASLAVGELLLSLKVGELDPVTKDNGLAQRLSNLGYFVPPAGERDKDELRSAIEEFQLEQGMKVTGESDAALEQKVLEVHGV